MVAKKLLLDLYKFNKFIGGFESNICFNDGKLETINIEEKTKKFRFY